MREGKTSRRFMEGDEQFPSWSLLMSVGQMKFMIFCEDRTRYPRRGIGASRVKLPVSVTRHQEPAGFGGR